MADFGTRSWSIRSKIVKVSGVVDMKSAPELREKLQAAFAKKPNLVLINLAQVTRMDSAGVAVLVEGQQWARQHKIILSLQSPSKSAMSALEVSRVDKLFNIYDGAEPQ